MRRLRPDELGVGCTADEAERLEHAGVELLKRGHDWIGRRQRACHEYASFVRDRHRRHAVSARNGETHSPFEHDGVHMEHVSGDELLEKILRARVAQGVDGAPQILSGIQLANPDRGGLRPRLQHPRRRHAGCPLVDRLIVEDVHEVGAADAGVARARIT